jgi:hypothetical protein
MATVRHLGLFPFCIPVYPPTAKVNDSTIIFPTGPYTQYPFATKTQQACAIWWRVKKWKLTFTFSEYFDLALYEGLPSGSFVKVDPTTITLIGDTETGNGGSRVLIEKENDLICASGAEETSFIFSFEWQAQRVGQITNPPTPINYTQNYNASLFTNTDIQQSGFPPAFVFAEGQELQTNPDLWVAFGINIASFFSERPTATNYGSMAEVKCLGKTIGQISLGTEFNTESIGYTPTLSNVVVEPHEYWPYDPGDGGGPIYDSTTGAQLRPFPS